MQRLCECTKWTTKYKEEDSGAYKGKDLLYGKTQNFTQENVSLNPVGYSAFIKDMYQNQSEINSTFIGDSFYFHRMHILSHSSLSISLWAHEKVYSNTQKFYETTFLKTKYFKIWIHKRRQINVRKAEENQILATTHWAKNCLKKYFKSWKNLPEEPRSKVKFNFEDYDFLLQKHFWEAKKNYIKRKVPKDSSLKKKELQEKLERYLKRREYSVKLFVLREWERKRFERMYKHGHEVILTEKYFQWKEEEKEKRCLLIASLHYKVNLLSDCLHKWRLNTMEKLVKKRRNDVARIHYEDKLSAKIYKKWRERTEKFREEKENENRQLMQRTLTKWNECATLSRILTQRKFQIAKNFHNNCILKNIFDLWKNQHNTHKADRFYRTCRKRRVFKLWNLQHLKRKLQRRLARAHHRKRIQKQAFNKWRKSSEVEENKRKEISKQFNLIRIERFFIQWRKFVSNQQNLKLSAHKLERIQRHRILKNSLQRWKDKYAIKIFTNHHKQWKEEYLQRHVWWHWRGIIKDKYLEELVESNWKPVQNKIILKTNFQQWKHQKTKEDSMNRKVEYFRCILSQKTMHECLYNWRTVTQHDLLIKSFVWNINHKTVARCFCAWLLITKFKKQRQKSLELCQLKKIRNVFIHWRKIEGGRRYIRYQLIAEENIKAQKCITKWKDFVLMKISHRAAVVECCARRWLDVTQQNKLSREIVEAKKANDVILQKAYFCKWINRAQQITRERTKMEEDADRFHTKLIYTATFYCWIRQYNVQFIVREYLEKKQLSLLRRVFQGWLRITQDEITNQVANFNRRFDLLIDEVNLHAFQKSAQKRHTMPAIPSFVISTSSQSTRNMKHITQQKQGFNFQHQYQQQQEQKLSEEDCLVEQYKTEIEKLDLEEERRLCAMPDESNTLSFESDFEKDDLFMDGLNNNSSSEKKLFCDKSLNQTMESSVDSKVLSASWTDHWKLRYHQSQQNARRRRWIGFEPLSCSTAREISSGEIMCNEMTNLSCSSGVDSLSRCSKRSEILTRSLPFFGRCSSDENTLMTSGVYSLMTEDDMQSTVSSNTMADTEICRQKEAYLTRTIHHWKCFDISTVFYAWYKYSARKKFLRHDYQFILEKKQEFLMHSTFLKWNRSLYCKQVSTGFAWKQCIGRCFYKLRQYSLLQKDKHERCRLAHNKYRRSCLWRFLKTWKQKYEKKSKLCELMDVSVTTTSIKYVYTEQMQSHKKKWNTVKLNAYFTSWLERLRRKHIAIVYYENTIVSKMLNAWWCCNMMKENRRKKIKTFLYQHLLKRYFYMWKQRCYRIRIIDDLQQSKRNELMLTVFKAWSSSTIESVTKKQKVMNFINQQNRDLQNDALLEWKVHYQQQSVAKQHYKQILANKIFSSWRWTVKQQINRQQGLIHYEKCKHQSTVSKLFTWWKLSAKAEKKFRKNEKLNNDTLLRKTFETWRKFQLSERCRNYYSSKILGCYFQIWKKEYASRKKESYLMKKTSRKWFSLMESSQTNQKNLTILIEIKNEIALCECFTAWKQSTRMSMKAKQHYTLKITTKIFISWFVYSRRKIKNNKTFITHQRNYQQKLLQKVFFKWKESKNQIVDQRIVHMEQLTKAKEKYENSLKGRMLRAFCAYIRIQKIKKKRKDQICRKYGDKWKNIVAMNRLAVAIYKQKLLNKYWSSWRHNYIQQHVSYNIKKQDQRKLSSEVFIAWLEYTRMRRTLPILHSIQIKKIWFRKWMTAFNNS